MTPEKIAELRGLAEALVREIDSGQRTIGGASLSTDGKYESWGCEPIMRRVNPDGAKAAQAITALLDEVERLQCEAQRCRDNEYNGAQRELAAVDRSIRLEEALEIIAEDDNDPETGEQRPKSFYTSLAIQTLAAARSARASEGE